MDAAVLVTKETKFGQVCLEKEILTNEGLWLALRSQALTVIKSIFMQENIVFTLEEGVKAPTEIALWESTSNIITQCASYGSMYRYFVKKLNEDTELRVPAKWKQVNSPEEGTYVSDLIQLCDEKIKYSDILEASKLLPANTVDELFGLYGSGGLALSGENDSSLPKGAPHLARLKGLIEAYEMVVNTIQKVYASVGKELP